MSESLHSEEQLLDRARSGVESAFADLVAPLRRELHVHCYRMLGSIEDADDALQDSLVRAWRQIGTFEPRAPFRAWLYRIATNVCLTMSARPVRKREISMAELESPRSRHTSREAELMHLEPYPDRWLDELPAQVPGPEATVELAESVELAFIAATQALPPGQRATLMLRDVLGYPAADAARMLDTSVAGINSALQRARATLARERQTETMAHQHRRALPADEDALVGRLIAAWHAADIGAIVSLLREDAFFAMPPDPRVVGLDAIAGFLAAIPSGLRLDQYRLVPIRANRQPALALYSQADGDAPYRPSGIIVLSCDCGKVASMTRFGCPHLFERFGLPLQLTD